MTELSVFIPKELVVTPETLISEQQLPLIPADRLRGIIHPDRLPFLVARQEDVDSAIALHEDSIDPHPQYAKDSDLATHAADMTLHGGNGSAINITNSQIASNAAIAWTKIDKTGATAADVGATSALHAADQSIHVPASGLGNNQIANDAAIAWTKISKSGASASDVGATAIGHTHQTSDIIGLTSSQFPKTVAELTYTFTQSSNNPAGSYSIMTDGSNTTGAGTTDEGGTSYAWLKADLGASKHIEHIRIQGGAITGWTSTSTYWNNVIVEVSEDNTNWMILFPQGACTTSDTSLIRYFSAYVKARYLRFKRLGYLAMTELRIYGFDP